MYVVVLFYRHVKFRNLFVDLQHIMRKFIVFLIGATFFAVCGCSGPAAWRKAEGSMWHTLYSVTYRSDMELDDSIVETMRRVEMSLSPFQSNSLVSCINRGEPVVVDSMIRRIFTCSQTVSRLSGGMFDPTVAPLVNYWGFGYAGPDGEPLDSVMSRVGISECRIGPDGVIEKKHPRTEFNFSAITKGYGCDAVGEMLRRNGCEDFLVEIGGEICLSGESPRGGAWNVMIDAPVDNADAVVHSEMMTLSLTGCGIATSGNYRNYRMTDRGKTSHTISPVTGMPVTLVPADTLVLSATVVAPSAMEADALATACMLLPPSLSRGMMRAAGASRLILAVSTPADSLLILDMR